MRGTVYLATLPNGFFGSSGSSWKSLSANKMAEDLKKSGYKAEVISVHCISAIDLRPEDVIFYTSSDDAIIRSYVKDYIYLASKFCTVAPSFDALMAHENKGFQQIFRQKMEFGDLGGSYFFHKDEAPKNYPYVYKTSTGAGSSGVELITDKSDFRKISRNFRVGFYRFFINLARRIKLSPSEFSIYSYRHKAKCLSVAQDYIPGLTGDYKVLIFGDKYFILQRLTSKRSFKASGSGRFSFPGRGDVPNEVLDYADAIYKKIDVPYASLDIAISNGACFLIEYQATNFGPYTLVNSAGYFALGEGGWEYVEGKSDLQESFSAALLFYLRKKDVG